MLKQIQTILILLGIIIFLSSGCTTHKRIQNKTLESTNSEKNHHLKFKTYSDLGDIFLALSFSGGGTRAAAFSYGLLSELRDTHISINGFNVRLLDEIDHISSVSGGSFTAAYYGLFGDQIFNDFESVFLRNNVQKVLIGSVLNPLNWFSLLSSDFDRSTLASEYYDKHIFKGSTFGDMASRKGPFIHINATDLITGQPFSFTQESFALLCSDLSKFKVATAVAASSAVPVAFPPITLKNHPCDIEIPNAIDAIQYDTKKDIRLQVLSKGISSYLDKDR